MAGQHRTSEGGLERAMHAKAAIADEQVAFVTSANLTGSAIEANMELGLLVRGGAVPRRLARHFRALMGAGHLEEVSA
jgi:cardiolipin synthase